MKHEFRAVNLAQAVAKATGRKQALLQTKNSATINSGIGGSSNSGSITADVELGLTYTISWDAEDAAGGGAIYSIRISSHDGHGSYDETFTDSGSWNFEAHTTGTIEFTVEISFSSGSIFFSYPIHLSIT